MVMKIFYPAPQLIVHRYSFVLFSLSLAIGGLRYSCNCHGSMAPRPKLSSEKDPDQPRHYYVLVYHASDDCFAQSPRCTSLRKDPCQPAPVNRRDTFLEELLIPRSF
jgi:hypothetical protein